MKLMKRYRRTLNARVGSKSGYILLLFFASLLLSMSVNAQTEPKSPGWNINTGAGANSQPKELIEQEPSAPSTEPEQPAANQSLSQVDEPSTGNDLVIQSPETQLTEPTIDLSPELRRDLEAQFQRIRTRLETDDAFSEALGEEYLSYGLLLKKAGQLDEARKMFVDALHIAKVNNGIYSPEQKPMLHALFEINYLLEEVEDFEDNLKRILWLEKKDPGPPDRLTFEQMVKAGNYFIDLFLYRPVAGELSLSYLDRANKYLTAAVTIYGGNPINVLFMPYGELALVNYWQSKVADRVSRVSNNQLGRPRQSGSFSNTTRSGLPNRAGLAQLDNSNILQKSFSRGEHYLKRYLQKARDENNLEATVSALINLGDVNLLFNRRSAAAQYYEVAWVEAQQLSEDHPIISSFQMPVELPAFTYSQPRDFIERPDRSMFIPLMFDVDKNGKVGKVAPLEGGAESVELFSRARRATRRLLFRPVIEKGKMVGSDLHTHNVRVLVKKKTPS